MKKILMFSVVMSLIGTVVFAQTGEVYTQHPGYVEFGNFDLFKDADKTIEISIREPLLRFVAKMTAQQDIGLAHLLEKLLLIQVNVFSVEEGQMDAAAALIQETSDTMQTENWYRMVHAKERDEHVEVYMQLNESGVMTGLAVMALGVKEALGVDTNEAVFINIVGDIDPEQLGKLSAKFNIPTLNDLDFNYSHGAVEALEEESEEDEPDGEIQ